ncbi:uncharacterized protein LOC119361403 [Triticum dicoccoides]|uniref:uncharacterized protein LOC119361403 n=1 Tax=Triticum dicoccoides TaxID=85692 RepID=UPI00188FBB83|nr:uncharacterized protein LOC119361403 [Triticum dicoccoides]
MADHLSIVFSSLRILLQGSSSTEGQLAYRHSIRSVSVLCPEWPIRSTLSGQSGSNYDSSSSSASRSNNSGYSSNSASVSEADLGTSELTKIAHRMVSDGYTQCMVRAFHSTSLTETTALNNWFVELDVDWVLQLQPPLHLQTVTMYWRQELVQRWIRALTIIVASMNEVMLVDHEVLAVARFGKASISAMLGVVDTMLDVIVEDKLQVALHMYMCVSSASLMMMPELSLKAQRIFDGISVSSKTQENGLVQAISSTTMDIGSEYYGI